MSGHGMFYVKPEAMEPLFPVNSDGELEELSSSLFAKSNKLSGILNVNTRIAIEEMGMLSEANYCLELLQNYSIFDKVNHDDLRKIYLDLSNELIQKIHTNRLENNPYSRTFLKLIHRRIYEKMAKFHTDISMERAGEYRNLEIELEGQVAPYSEKLDAFLEKFENTFSSKTETKDWNSSRIISIAVAHHRLNWMQPFDDFNEWVVFLFTKSCFAFEGLGKDLLWTFAGSLLQDNSGYERSMMAAGKKRKEHELTKGNLSNEGLIEFSKYFLTSSLAEVDRLLNSFDTGKLMKGIEIYVENQLDLRPESRFLLESLFLKGRITKSEALQIAQTSDKTLKITTDRLKELGFLRKEKIGKQMMYYLTLKETSFLEMIRPTF